jgi:hypothetical protein
MKSFCSLEELRAKMQQSISENTWASGYCADCPAPTPYRIPHDGVANWTAPIAATAKPGCEGVILQAIAAVRKDYDLEPEPLADLVARLLKQPS